MASPRTGKRATTDVRVTTLARTPLAASGVARLAAAVLRAEGAELAALSITFVGPARIRSLNRLHLGRDRETDVIAFAMGGPADGRTGGRSGRRPPDRPTARPPLVADIYICPSIATREAKRAGTTVKDEVRRLVVHGVLHALGYDHPAGAARRLASPMWRRQERHVRAHGGLAR